MPPSRRAQDKAFAKDIRAGLDHLSAEGDLAHTCLTLERGLAADPITSVQADWLGLLERFVPSVRAAHPQAAWLSVRLYSSTRQPDKLLGFVAQALGHLSAADARPLRAYQAFALTVTGRHAQALDVLGDVLPALGGLAAGIGWRARGQALFGSGQDDWQAALTEAKRSLRGRALGLCWAEEGNRLEYAGRDEGARDAWRQALPLLEGDPYYRAWLRHALGSSCLRFALPEAEDHFLELGQLVKSPEAAQFRPWAACGLGAARRSRGEWDRALSSYRGAIKLAHEPEDLRQAWRGLGHTQRLMGKPDLALEALHRAKGFTEADSVSGASWVFADIAACYAQLGQVQAAHAALAQTGDALSREDAERVAIVRAELARQAGDPDTALELLASVRPETLWVREEARCFPALFALLPPQTRPRPLAYTAGVAVEVHALGALVVRVNGRPVRLRASGRPAELLAYLLDQGNRAPTEHIVDALYPSGEARRNAQALWAVVRELRSALGWDGSVQSSGGVYSLDPAAQWWYDVREALIRGEPTRQFLSGNYRAWALSRAEELEGRQE